MATQLATTDDQPRQLSDRRETYAIMKDKARAFAMSPLIPDSLRAGGPDVAFANCMIALELANVMGENPLVVMQNIHIVKGKAGFAAQYMIARANASGVFKGRIGWRLTGKGETLSAEAYGTLADTGEEVSFTADMAMAKAEGWTSNPKYKTMPEVMLRYRSATFLVRFYAPDVMLGYRTTEEYEDVAATASPVGRPFNAAALIAQASAEPGVDPGTGEIETGRSDEQHGDQHDDAHPGTAIADDLVARYARATVIADSLGADHDFTIHGEAMLGADRNRVEVAKAASDKRMGR